MLYFYAHKFFNYKDIKCNLDQIIAFYNYIYDLNYQKTCHKILEGKYYEKFNNRLKEVYHSPKVHEQLDNLLLYANRFLRTKGNC